MPKFIETIRPTPFGFFDSDPQFQAEADGMVVFVKRKLGDDVLSVELSSKEIWSCFEEACCEYSRLVHEMKIQSELINVLGLPTGSTDLTNIYPRQSLEFLIRQSEPYATEAFLGGSYDAQLGYIDMSTGTQDYNIYESIKETVSGSNLWLSSPSGSRGKMRILDVFHYAPTPGNSSVIDGSNTANFLANNFNYESYTQSTVFQMLPVFEDVLRRGMLETAMRVRRSNYSFEIIGSNLRIYPIPSDNRRVYVKVYTGPNNNLFSSTIGISVSGSYGDSTPWGVSGPSNFPVNNLPFSTISQPGRQWIRQFTLALAKELLGLIRSKFQSIPIPNAELTLNGDSLRADGREDQGRLRDQIREWLDKLTNAALVEQQANLAELLNKQLRLIPMPGGRAITVG